MSGVLNNLAERVIPNVMAKLQQKGLTELCNISRTTQTADANGVLSDSWADTNLIAVPCSPPEAKGYSRKDELTGSWTSYQGYSLTLPTNQAGVLIDIQPKDRIVVEARGNQPEKTFKVISVKNDSGVVLEILCNLEN